MLYGQSHVLVAGLKTSPGWQQISSWTPSWHWQKHGLHIPIKMILTYHHSRDDIVCHLVIIMNCFSVHNSPLRAVWVAIGCCTGPSSSNRRIVDWETIQNYCGMEYCMISTVPIINLKIYLLHKFGYPQDNNHFHGHIQFHHKVKVFS